MGEKRNHKIYVYTCKISGKVYIGRTHKELKERAGYMGNKYKGCSHFWNAIQKYGWDNFEPTILEEGLSAEEASYRELHWIKEYNSTNKNKGYNIRDKICSDFSESSCKRSKDYVNPMRGKKHSEEAKRKMSEHGKGRCKGRVPWNKGIPMDDETKEKLRQLNVGEKNPFYGRKHSKESIEKMSESHKNMSEETKGKIRESKKNLSKESRYRLSEGVTKHRVLCMETQVVYRNSKEAFLNTGVHKDSIGNCCRGTQKTAGGYHWQYLDKLDNTKDLKYNEDKEG